MRIRDWSSDVCSSDLNVPLVKRVAAAAGDEVCAAGARVMVNGRIVARRFERDGTGRPMPWWSGCAELRPGEFFLLMTDRARKRVGSGKSVSVRVDLGGARLITKNTVSNTSNTK